MTISYVKKSKKYQVALATYKKYTKSDAEKEAWTKIKKLSQDFKQSPFPASSKFFDVEEVRKVNEQKTLPAICGNIKKKIELLDHTTFSYNDVVPPLHQPPILLRKKYKHLYNEALAYAKDVENAYSNIIEEEKKKYVQELKTISSSISADYNGTKLSTLFPEMFKPMKIDFLSDIKLTLHSSGSPKIRGISKQGVLLSPTSFVDINTYSLCFDTITLYLYENELILDANDYFSIVSYKDVDLTYSMRSVSNSWNDISTTNKSTSLCFTIGKEEYKIEFESSEAAIWLFWLINGRQKGVSPSIIELASFVLEREPQALIAKSVMGKHIIDTCKNSMITIEGGSFTQGYNYHIKYYPYNDHRRNLEESTECGERILNVSTFKIGKDVVSKQLWDWIMYESYTGGDGPIEDVSSDEIMSFIEKLNKYTGLVFRLPTEIEWEFAARGGNASKNYLFSGSNSLCKSQEIENELGLIHMSGYVWQLCADEYQVWSKGRFDIKAYTGGKLVMRGGSQDSSEDECIIDSRKCKSTSIGSIGADGKTHDYIPYQTRLCCPSNRSFGLRGSFRLAL